LGLGRTHIPRRPEIRCLSGQRPNTIIPICGRESPKQAALCTKRPAARSLRWPACGTRSGWPRRDRRSRHRGGRGRPTRTRP